MKAPSGCLDYLLTLLVLVVVGFETNYGCVVHRMGLSYKVVCVRVEDKTLGGRLCCGSVAEMKGNLS